jgi:hypothetical protein
MILSHCFFNEQLGLEVVNTCDTIESVLGEGKKEKRERTQRGIFSRTGQLDPSCYAQELRVPLHKSLSISYFRLEPIKNVVKTHGRYANKGPGREGTGLQRWELLGRSDCRLGH